MCKNELFVNFRHYGKNGDGSAVTVLLEVVNFRNQTDTSRFPRLRKVVLCNTRVHDVGERRHNFIIDELDNLTGIVIRATRAVGSPLILVGKKLAGSRKGLWHLVANFQSNH